MGNLFNELKRRNVVRVGIAYMVLGWVAFVTYRVGGVAVAALMCTVVYETQNGWSERRQRLFLHR